MSDDATRDEQTAAPAARRAPKKRSRRSKLLEFLFWVLVALATAWIMIQNVDTILPANNF